MQMHRSRNHVSEMQVLGDLISHTWQCHIAAGLMSGYVQDVIGIRGLSLAAVGPATVPVEAEHNETI
jgi:hypothetical protein